VPAASLKPISANPKFGKLACYANVVAFHFGAAVGGFCLGVLCSNFSSLSDLGLRDLDS
jgi:hypothetical protein